METRANYVAVGAFVLAMLVAIVVAVAWLGATSFNREFAHYDIYFPGSVSGLNQGSAVLYNGIQVGRVIEIRLNPKNVGEVRVTIEVDPTMQIKSDASASLEVQGLTGTAVINITGGSQDAPLLVRHEGERYPVIASRQSGLQQFVTSAPEALARLIDVADRLSQLFDEKNRAAIADTLQNVRQLTAVAAGRSADIDKTLADAAVAAEQLRETASELRELFGPGDARNMFVTLSDTAKKLDHLADHVDSLVQENRPPLHDFTQNGLSQLSQLLVDARALVGNLNRITDELERDPPRFLFGADRREGYQPR
jgi:phospholipid/cholesterol/gamma-HCH transport system substrate-binding protein